MGRKVHPYGFRLGVSRTWTAKWYADKDYTTLLKEDIAIRQLVQKRLANASVSQVEIERGINHVTVTVHTAKPGIVIGKGGANVEVLRQQIGALSNRKVKLEIKEIRQPELDAYLVAMNIAQQLSRRIAFRKAMKQAVQRTMKAGAKGVKVAVSGPPRRLRDGTPRVGPRGSDPAGDAPRGHQLRAGARPHDLRPDRREGLDLPRRGADGAPSAARGRSGTAGGNGSLTRC
jgi:small subunit ribosomal protein S3